MSAQQKPAERDSVGKALARTANPEMCIRDRAQHGHAHRLQIFQREADVQNHFGAGAHHYDAGFAQLLQIGADVHGGLCAAVHAADAARGEHADARQRGNDHGGGHRGGEMCIRDRYIPA